MKHLTIYGSRDSADFNVAAISYDGHLASASTLMMAMNVIRNRGDDMSDVMRWDVHSWDEHVWG